MQPKTDEMAKEGGGGTEERSADSHAGFDPGVPRRFLERDERAHEGDEHRRAHFQSEMFRGEQVAAFVQEQQDDKTDAPFPAPELGIDPDHEDHRAARFQDDREEFEKRENEEFQLRAKFQHDDADHDEWTEKLPRLAPEAFARAEEGREFVGRNGATLVWGLE